MHWENENKKNLLMSESEVDDDRDDNGLDDDDDALDRSSISSENSCCDVLTESSPMHQTTHRSQSPKAKVWHSIPDIDENILKELPNADRILDDLMAENWESKLMYMTYMFCQKSWPSSFS